MADLLLALAGLALLLAAGDLLVRGAVGLSRRLRIPALIVGLTVVSLGTSAPELVVSVQAALAGSPGIAVGNVIGSNIANLLLVLGLSAVIASIGPAEGDSRRSYLQMLGASLLLVVLCFTAPLGLPHAAVLLLGFGLVLWDMLRKARRSRRAAPPPEAEGGVPPLGRTLALLLVGLAGLPFGAHLLIDGAVSLADRFGVSEAVIGLTLVALGTSLPELAATGVAAFRGRTDVALGNVIGSNLFNILLILGVTSLFGPVPVAPEFLVRDLWIMLAASLALAPVVFRGRSIGRPAGAAFLSAYAAFTLVLFAN